MNFLWGIDRKPFYDLNQYPAMVEIQQNYQLILEELCNNKMWLNWGSDNYDYGGHCQFLAGTWTICPLYFGNYRPDEIKGHQLSKTEILEIQNSLPLRFPKTHALLKRFQQVNFAALSKLNSKSRLAPHRHNNPLSLIFHLGIVIPPGESCGLQVENQIHLWNKPGDAIIFDDNFKHSAWNDSDEDRIVLYLDFLRFL